MGKIIPLNKPKSSFKVDDNERIRQESDQEDLNEKRRKNKRIEKWDNIFYVSFILLILFAFLIASGIVPISSNLLSILFSSTIPLIIGLIRFILKRNTS